MAFEQGICSGAIRPIRGKGDEFVPNNPWESSGEAWRGKEMGIESKGVDNVLSQKRAHIHCWHHKKKAFDYPAAACQLLEVNQRFKVRGNLANRNWGGGSSGSYGQSKITAGDGFIKPLTSHKEASFPVGFFITLKLGPVRCSGSSDRLTQETRVRFPTWPWEPMVVWWWIELVKITP